MRFDSPGAGRNRQIWRSISRALSESHAFLPSNNPSVFGSRSLLYLLLSPSTSPSVPPRSNLQDNSSADQGWAEPMKPSRFPNRSLQICSSQIFSSGKPSMRVISETNTPQQPLPSPRSGNCINYLRSPAWAAGLILLSPSTWIQTREWIFWNF
jgi:hypothetical protein